MAPPPKPIDRALLDRTLIEAFREMASAVRDSNSQRSKDFKELIAWLENHASEEKVALLELITALKRKGFRISIGEGENTSTLHLGDGHWLAVRPFFVKAAVWITTSAAFAKLLAYLTTGAP